MTTSPPSVDPVAFARLVGAISRGSVALWLGPRSAGDPVEESEPFIAAQPWLAVWSEGPRGVFVEAMVEATAQRRGIENRPVLHVTGHADEALGPGFSLTSGSPFFVLPTAGGRKADYVRASHLAACARLGTSTVIVAGCRTSEKLDDLLEDLDAVCPPDATPPTLYVAGWPTDATLPTTARQYRGGLAVDPRPIVELLQATVAVAEPGREGTPSLRVGDQEVPLRPLIQGSPPLDQHFYFVTSNDLRPPEAGEDAERLFQDLLIGRLPAWRAFAHQLAWDRAGAIDRLTTAVRQRLDRGARVRREAIRVRSEPTAGLTTTLHAAAYGIAGEGIPVLIHRPGAEFDYARLRAFLSDLRQQCGRDVDVAVFFDLPSAKPGVRELAEALPARLAKEGNEPVVVLGDAAPEAPPRYRRVSRADPPSPVVELTDLDQGALESLTRWAKEHESWLAADGLVALREWSGEVGQLRVPLLAALYYILQEGVRSAVDLGAHLVRRFERSFPFHTESPSEQDTPPQDARPLTDEELRHWLPIIQRALASGSRERKGVVDRPEAAAGLLVLATLGTLGQVMPVRVLAGLFGWTSTELWRALGELEASGLVMIQLLDTPAGSFNPLASDTLSAPAVFYSATEAATLRHPIYGRLLLEHIRGLLAPPPGFAAHDIGDGILQSLREASTDLRRALPEFPLGLLAPILRRLRPTDPSHRLFAEQIGQSLLRLQREEDREAQGFPLAVFQWQHPDLLESAYGWMDPGLLAQSSALLHGRGMLYKVAVRLGVVPQHVEERFVSACDDLNRAVALAEQDPSQEDAIYSRTSLGFALAFWAAYLLERGDNKGWHDKATEARRTLAAALDDRPDNVHAAYALAKQHVHMARVLAESGGEHLHELESAFDLLQMEPEPSFRTKWEDLRSTATEMLSGPAARAKIVALQAAGDRLGWALAALRELGGVIPHTGTPAAARLEPQQIEKAHTILAEAPPARTPTPLADLLWYATFSVLQQRDTQPAFGERFARLQLLGESRFLRTPIWAFDLAMLGYQVGDYACGERWFAWLRRGRRFLEVPVGRAQFLTAAPDSLVPRIVTMDVIAAHPADTTGWARVPGLPNQVAVGLRDFRDRGIRLVPGLRERARIRLRPAGPMAVPIHADDHT